MVSIYMSVDRLLSFGPFPFPMPLTGMLSSRCLFLHVVLSKITYNPEHTSKILCRFRFHYLDVNLWQSFKKPTLLLCTWLFCLLFYVLATSEVIREQVSIVAMYTHGYFYGAALLGDQAANTMTWYSIQSNYLDAEPTSSGPILIRLST